MAAKSRSAAGWLRPAAHIDRNMPAASATKPSDAAMPPQTTHDVFRKELALPANRTPPLSYPAFSTGRDPGLQPADTASRMRTVRFGFSSAWVRIATAASGKDLLGGQVHRHPHIQAFSASNKKRGRSSREGCPEAPFVSCFLRQHGLVQVQWVYLSPRAPQRDETSITMRGTSKQQSA